MCDVEEGTAVMRRLAVMNVESADVGRREGVHTKEKLRTGTNSRLLRLTRGHVTVTSSGH